ncbi:FtsX-like permease family protein [Massilia forsythiae]|uniref:FtsX-like permease family protein n=1 Tax=Massilia forsythiae TaxID=2728020 RepID=A0A7Z2VZ02_9BURK|nr:ABC transporter permease [Massilia forsythiae]QJE01695.1 FtsX-like permease family protein [Massilia forsythiae]
MNLRDLRLAWRQLAGEPVYSAVAILGLAVALAACFLLFGLVQHAWTYNAALAGAGEIVVVKERRNLLPRPDWVEAGPGPLGAAAVDAGLVRAATGARPAQVAARIGDSGDPGGRGALVKIELAVVEPNYLDFFGVHALAGDARAALARPDALVLSRSEALRLFGAADPIGRVLAIDGVPFGVRAVIPDLPPNTSPDFGILLGRGAHPWDPVPATADQAWSQRTRTYLKPAPGVDGRRLAAALERIVAVRRDYVFQGGLAAGHPKPYTSIAVTPLSGVYVDPDLLAGRAAERYGSPAAIAGLGLLALLILLLAATNYVNLAAVRTAARRREIGLRKALGVKAPRLAAQFLAESLLVAALSTLAGALLARAALPWFAQLVGQPIGGAYGPAAWTMLAGAGLGTGLLAGAWPAWMAARVPPSVALSGRSGDTLEGLRLRRVLTVAQFAAAIALVACTLTVGWQAHHAGRVDLGFDPRPQLVLQLPGDPAAAAAHAFKAAAARLPQVAGVAAMQDAVGRDGNKAVMLLARPGGPPLPVPVELKEVGADFFDVFGMRPLAGRLFAHRERNAVVLDARAALALGYATPQAAVGRMLDADNRIVGIAPDLRYNTLREKPEPIVYRLEEDQPVLTVRVRGSLPEARAALEALWARHFPDDAPDIETATSVFAENTAADRRQATLLALASGVATALACFGIFVLSAYTVRRRAREIVLRKLHGAGARHVGLLVAREWLLLFAAGTLLAVPPAWVWSERYLAGFVERAPMGAWPLVLACLGVGGVALAACTRQALAAMRMAPALALRD